MDTRHLAAKTVAALLPQPFLYTTTAPADTRDDAGLAHGTALSTHTRTQAHKMFVGKPIAGKKE